jgi:hypothetical protein
VLPDFFAVLRGFFAAPPLFAADDRVAPEVEAFARAGAFRLAGALRVPVERVAGLLADALRPLVLRAVPDDAEVRVPPLAPPLPSTGHLPDMMR